MTDETGEDLPTTPSGGWAGPPAWGSTPATGPAPPAVPPEASGGGWNYGYGGLWTPPPEPPRRPANPARRVAAAIAIAVLVLVSGVLGAVVSSAVHDNPKPAPVASPFVPGANENGFGLDPTTGNDTASGNTSAIAAKVSPALVNIYTTIETASGRGQAAGTGMIISSSGEVLTNNHVIADASTVRVELVASGETHTAKVLGYDVKDDVALLQIDNVSDLNTVSFADASKVAIGDPVVAIGNAGGRGGDPTVTSGSVTALNQKVTAGDQSSGVSETLLGMIEISAPIEPGDSGGPLVNDDGKVIGMNTAAATSGPFSGQTVSSTAFAIPINRVIRLARMIQDGEESATVHVGERGLLGVHVQDIDSQSACQPTTNAGALVAGVESDSPAEGAGLSACDVIVAVGGKSVDSTSELNDTMFPYHPDEAVKVRWIDQSGDSHEATLNLMAGPPA